MLWCFSQEPVGGMRHSYEAWLKAEDLERLEDAEKKEWEYVYLTRKDIRIRDVQSYIQIVEVPYAADD